MVDSLVVFFGRILLPLEILAFGGFFLTVPRKDKKRFAVLIVAGGLLSLALAHLCGAAYFSARPSNLGVLGSSLQLDKHVNDNGFPSSHALLAFTLAFLVYLQNKRAGWVFVATAFAISIARVLGHVHHVVDIAGAFMVAGIAVFGVNWLFGRLGFGRKYSNRHR